MENTPGKDLHSDQLEKVGLSRELKEVNHNLKELIKKTGQKSGRDFWDKFQITGSFISSVLFAGVGLYFTHVYNEREALREERLQNAQIEISQINAITNLTPLLASPDTNVKNFAWSTLQLIIDRRRTENTDTSVLIQGDTQINDPKAKGTGALNKGKLINSDFLGQCAQVLFSNKANLEEKLANAKLLAEVAKSEKNSLKIRQQATTYLSDAQFEKSIENDVKTYIKEALKEIRAIQQVDLAGEVNKIKTDRVIDKIIIGHTWMPDLTTYKGPSTIEGMARFQMEQMGYSNVSWHFMVAPDGMIWFGRNLNQHPAMVMGHNTGAIGIYLVLNGDKELPTEQQAKSLGLLLSALCEKYHIDPLVNFSSGSGFQRDYSINGRPNPKTSPGKLISKELILSYLEKSGN